MKNHIDNDLINLKNGKKRGYPFNDPNYRPCVATYETTKKRKDDTEVTRTHSRNTNPASLPEAALIAMFGTRQSLPVHNLRNSPMSKGRRQKNGSLKKIWIRPKTKRVWTQTAVSLIKDGLMKAIINPISKKILAGYVKTIRVFPPISKSSTRPTI